MLKILQARLQQYMNRELPYVQAGFRKGGGTRDQMVNGAMQETQVPSLGQEDPLEKGMATLSSILDGEFHGQRSLVDYSPWGHIESDRTQAI